MNYLKLFRTSDKDSFGCIVLRLQYFKNSQIIDELKVCSGQPGKQYFRKGVDSIAGSGEPLPEGRWILGNIKWARGKDNYDASQGNGIGPASVPLTYDGPGKTSRSAIEMHIDWNRTAGSPGTIGCVGFYSSEDYKKFVVWLRDTDPRELYVDWNLGSCPAVSSLVAKSSQLPTCGVELIKQFEGCYLNAYPDPLSGAKPITIGWGCTRKRDGSEWKLGEAITQNEADSLLIEQLDKNYLPKLAATIPYWSELNVNQQGALLSFGYNLGASFYNSPGFNSMSKMLRDRNWTIVKETFLKYRNPGTNVEEGLRRRRLAEANLFLKEGA